MLRNGSKNYETAERILRLADADIASSAAGATIAQILLTVPGLVNVDPRSNIRLQKGIIQDIPCLSDISRANAVISIPFNDNDLFALPFFLASLGSSNTNISLAFYNLLNSLSQ